MPIFNGVFIITEIVNESRIIIIMSDFAAKIDNIANILRRLIQKCTIIIKNTVKKNEIKTFFNDWYETRNQGYGITNIAIYIMLY